MNSTPLVSISCITYNHAPYIRQCLDGFLMQRTSFAFEVLVHDDASTDGTTEIIREYETRFPGIIKPLYEEENQWKKGRRGSAVFNFPRARGKYIALCEGDDYWTDPLKLQKQVDFLEANPEYGLVYGKARQYDQTQGKFRPGTIGAPLTDFTDLVIKGNLIPTATVLFRNELCKKYYEEDFPRDSWKMGDYPLWLFVSANSLMMFLDEEISVYRILENSAMGRHSFDSRIAIVESSEEVSIFFNNYYSKNLEHKIRQRYALGRFNIAYAYGKDEVLTKAYGELSPKSMKVVVKRYLYLVKKVLR